MRARIGFSVCLTLLAMMSLGSANAQDCVFPPSGLVNWWSGEGDAADFTGATPGTLVGDTTFATGHVGQAFSFDGNGDYVLLGSFGGFSELTVEAWVKTNDTTGTFQAIFASITQNQLVHFQLFHVGNNVAYTNSGSLLLPIAPDTPAGEFRHVAMTVKSGDSRVYVDGVLIGSSSYAFDTITPAAEVRIGAGHNGARFFDGLIDELSVYDRALSQSEIVEIFNAGSAGKCSCAPQGLVNYWRGDGDATDVAGDKDGTLVGDSGFAAGMVGQAFSFDGSDDYVSLGSFGGFPELTVEAWVMTRNTTGTFQTVFSSIIQNELVHVQLSPLGNNVAYTNGGIIFLPDVPETPTGVFRHIAMSLKSGDSNLYVDGVLLGNSDVAYGSIHPAAEVRIGGGNLEGRFFDGLIDEVSVYERALSQSEIVGIFNAGSAGKCPNNADGDGDGVPDVDDNCPGEANPEQQDTDLDGDGDACDDDDDNDTVPDANDNCQFTPNPDQFDLDQDGLGDICDADADGDGFANESDNCPNAPNPFQDDTDSDGQGDACDDDDDNDGICDTDQSGDGCTAGPDNCDTTPNPGQEDLDGDGIGDACDADLDGDGIDNDVDNCPLDSNAAQDDTDLDGDGDACDADDDDDGIPDAGDNCPLVSNLDQTDTDGDGEGDACDDDLDGDGIDNAVDNCPIDANASQNDLDGDGVGDACDADIDGDGVSNAQDLCAGTPAGAVVDPGSGCSIAQLAPCDGQRGSNKPWKNHGRYVSSVAHAANHFFRLGLITAELKSAIVAAAAQSGCGK